MSHASVLNEESRSRSVAVQYTADDYAFTPRPTATGWSVHVGNKESWFESLVCLVSKCGYWAGENVVIGTDEDGSVRSIETEPAFKIPEMKPAVPGEAGIYINTRPEPKIIGALDGYDPVELAQGRFVKGNCAQGLLYTYGHGSEPLCFKSSSSMNSLARFGAEGAQRVIEQGRAYLKSVKGE
jgi:hypothetical protein